MYMVTVVATDKKKLAAKRDVVITVTNVEEDGSVKFSSVQPQGRTVLHRIPSPTPTAKRRP